jgi:sugar phosphate isomerase/epimerase
MTDDTRCPSPSRRAFLGRSLAVATWAAAAGRTTAAAFDAPLGFMLHAVRVQAARDFPGTLRTIAGLGYGEVELVSFKGYASPSTRDGFGPLAPLPPAEIRSIIRDARLTATSAHFKYEELQEERVEASLGWARGVGLQFMTIADMPALQTLDQWKREFVRLNQLGEQVRAAGMQLGLHTQNNHWMTLDGELVMDALLRAVEPRNCRVELDLSTTQSMGLDPVPVLRRHAQRFFAIHLRDAKAPAQLGNYVSSIPLGQGDLDIKGIVAAARAAGIDKYIVEMQVVAPADPIEALRISAAYLRSLDV